MWWAEPTLRYIVAVTRLDPPVDPRAPQLDYAVNASTHHGRLFSAFLIALGFLCMLIIGQFIIMGRSASLSPDSRWVYQFVIFQQALFLLVVVMALVARAALPRARRVITIAVSIILLLHFPFGTAI